MQSPSRRLARHVGATLAGLAALALSVGLTTAAAAPAAADTARPAGAVFVQLNQPGGNEIAAYARASDGTLTEAGRYATGGLGGIAGGAPFDALASQGSLVLDPARDTLLAVNAGSDTLTSFDVSGRVELEQRSVVPSGGDFPVSVTVRKDLVYVLNAGGTGNVTGYRLRDSRLVPIPGATRDLGLANTSPPLFITAPSQVGLSPDGRHLVVATKANGVLLSFDVDRRGNLSTVPHLTTSPGPVPFSFDFDSKGRAVVTQAGNGGLETYSFDRSGTLVLDGVSESGGGTALCWNLIVGKTVYGANAGSDTISTWRLPRSGIPQLTAAVATVTEAAPLDLAASRDGRYLYELNAVAGTIGSFAIGEDGALTPVSTLTGIPVFEAGVSGPEGVAAS